MKVIGLTGGVGSGKSFVAGEVYKQFYHYDLPAELILTDDLAHDVMKSPHPCFLEVVKAFSKDILTEDGHIDRAKMAQKVYANPDKLKLLNQIVHPYVKQEIEKILDEAKNQDGIVLLESAILFESGCDKYCDEIWYIHVSEDLRKKRLQKDRGYTDQKTESIIRQQNTEAFFREHCDVVIDNCGDKESLLQQIGELVLREME